MGIFKQSDEYDGSEIQPVARVERVKPEQPKSVSVIGPTMDFKGELSADEDLIIEGQVEGSIAHHNKHLTVGRQGRVKADIHASSVIVLGKLIGDIHSEGSVTLSKGANVQGNIFCGRIVMEDGARFKGSIDMGDPKTVAAAPSPEKAAQQQKRQNAAQGHKKANIG